MDNHKTDSGSDLDDIIFPEPDNEFQRRWIENWKESRRFITQLRRELEMNV